ncbi:TadE/TadG family type IV pilus assembly protein [Bradyrhizobium sp.]|uniref:TadE/TadG family type IV pilus assembly protein n=1 Tax=Bradyrhizobium sp. TaxID=376 RepID=UPI002DF94CEC|nr:TadE/TadG family type IV pilus assembly protein [Bradyrhizobium sp.]
MKIFARSGPSPSLRRSALRLLRDKRGNAAVEFAVIVPLMLVIFFGTIEFSSAVAVDRKISMLTQGLADLVSRYPSVHDVDITNFGKIANAMLTPYSSTPLKTTITEIYVDPSTGVARAQWSKGDAPRTAGSTAPLPANLIARDAQNKIIADQYLIFTETSYLYKPAVGYVMGIGGVPLGDKTYMRPRIGSCVLYNTDTGNCPKS